MIYIFKEEQAKLEAIQKMAEERKRYVDKYICIENRINEDTKQGLKIAENIKEESNELKIIILKLNEGLNSEFDCFENNRAETLNKIIGCYSHTEIERAKIIGKFAAQEKIQFPIYGPGTSLLISSKLQ